MDHKLSGRFDILIIGGGFAGSITALCLNSAGYKVGIIEKSSHPRFAVGESSTPVADMILRDLSTKYRLPDLRKLSRYGSWQQHYPNVTCGIKRGFSYYHHQYGTPFEPDPNHRNELHVAASVNDRNSDTQWLRADVDLFLFDMAKNAGVQVHENTTITSASYTSTQKIWTLTATTVSEPLRFTARFIIDATGTPAFSKQFLGTESTADPFKTNSRALYTHFEHVPFWLDILTKQHHNTADYPYNPDHSALHHLLDIGWMWMLRFNTGLLSAGILIDQNNPGMNDDEDPKVQWNTILQNYPSLQELFSEATVAEQPGKLLRTGRLQRRLDSVYGTAWAALPHTGGFVDPLHSTGIAHTLKGVETLLDIIESSRLDTEKMNRPLELYQKALFRELDLIDMLVSGCYKARRHTKLFHAFTMLYFICTVQYEQSRLNGSNPDHFLCANHPRLYMLIAGCLDHLSAITDRGHSTDQEKKDFINRTRQKINPFNNVGLMDPSKKNLYKHTAVEIS